MTSSAPAYGFALPDELLLLALDDERGTRSRSDELEPGLGGAVVLDLALRGRLDVVGKKVVVVDPMPTADPVLDALLDRIADQSGQRSAKHWVVKGAKGVRDQVTERLVAAGALRREERRTLGLFRTVRYPSGDGGPEALLRSRLDTAVRTGLADERTAALAALVSVVGLQRAVFGPQDREERRATRRRLAEFADGQWAAAAVRKAIADITAATAAAATASSGGDGGGDGGSS